MRRFVVGTVLFVLMLGGAAAFSLPEEDVQAIFTGYMTRFSKVYELSSVFSRYSVFKQNYHQILTHNNLPSHLRKGITLGATSLTDLTAAEYRQMLGFRSPKPVQVAAKRSLKASARVAVDEGPLGTDEEVDWRTRGAVNNVKNQGMCGACWAFSAVAAAEAAVFLESGKLPSLSEQQLVDCAGPTTAYQCQGCNGCLMANAFRYMIDHKGLCTEAEYPYTAADGKCKVNTGRNALKCATSVPIKRYRNITCDFGDVCDVKLEANETSLYEAVKQGVVSVAIQADQDVFQNYLSGVIDSPACGTTLDHGVAIVGFGTEDGKDYWLVRNSWGPSWGLDGYVKLARGKNMCGVATYSNIPFASDE